MGHLSRVKQPAHGVISRQVAATISAPLCRWFAMAALEDVQRRLRQRPFQPFVMYLTDGSQYEVRHPELLLLGRRSLILGLTTEPGQTVNERAIDIDLLHVVRMEPSGTQTPSNGEPAG